MIARFNGNVVPFADDATSTNRTVFGGTTQSDAIDDNLNADFKKGWEIVGLNDNPTREDFNAMGYTLGALISYLYEMGISEWNASQNYRVNSRVIGSDGKTYKALTGTTGTPNVNHNPTSDAVNWELESNNKVDKVTSTDEAIPRFNGTTGEIQNSGVIIGDNDQIYLPSNGVIRSNSQSMIQRDDSTDTTLIGSGSAGGKVAVYAGGQEKMRIDSAGNVVIGATPKNSTYTSLQIKDSITSVGTTGVDKYSLTNSYYNGSWKRIKSGFKPTRMIEYDGGYSWDSGNDGVADGAITWTNTMAIDNSGNLKFNSGYGSVATAYGCRAWVNFNGTGTVAINASGNVSSITDNGTGQYTANFTTAMPDSNYGANTSGTRTESSTSVGFTQIYTQSSSSIRVTTTDTTGTVVDFPRVNISIFR